jgi:hypothetical protein
MKEYQYSYEDAWRWRNSSAKLLKSGTFVAVGLVVLFIGWYSNVLASLFSLVGYQLAWPLEAVPIGAPVRPGSAAFEWSSVSRLIINFFF